LFEFKLSELDDEQVALMNGNLREETIGKRKLEQSENRSLQKALVKGKSKEWARSCRSNKRAFAIEL
jgi:hypothetical protein